ncbi:tetratricopeptide repeat protein [Candidatus Poribacteria bacterium]|nr:tetratricopeptide repeat protein [Candidatus Poribacteria bacterium]
MKLCEYNMITFRKSFNYLFLITFIFISLNSSAMKPEELGEPLSVITPLIDARNYDKALDKLQSYADSDSDTEHLAEIYYLIGFINHEYTHDYKQALFAYQKVVSLRKKSRTTASLEPYLALSRMSIAGIHRRTGEYQDSIDIYSEIISDYPDTEYARVASRNIKGIEDAQDEIKAKREIIKRYPATEFAVEAQFEIAELYLSAQSLNNPQRAIQEYQKVVEMYSNSRRASESLLKIGNIYRMILHEPQKAINSYQHLLNTKASSGNLEAEALFRIGRTYYSELQEYKKSQEAFSKFLNEYRTYWKYPAAVYWTGMCYEQMGDYNESVKALRMFVAIYPDIEPEWLADIGRLGERNVKDRIIEKIAEMEESAPRMLWKRAEDFQKNGDYNQALVELQKLIWDYPESEFAVKAKDMMENLVYLAEIQTYREKVKNGGIEAPASQFRIGEIYEMELGDQVTALKEYNKVASDYPDTYWAADALYRTGVIYSGLSVTETNSTANAKVRKIRPNYRKALESFNRLIQEYSYTYAAAKASFHAGELYRLRFKDYNHALKFYKAVLNNYPRRSMYVGEGYKDSLADEAHFRIGKLYYENLNEYDKALDTFKSFLRDFPNSCRRAAAYSFVASIQEKKKDRAAAVNSLEQILDMIVESDVQNSFFVREAIYEVNSSPGSNVVDLQLDMIKHLRRKISHLQE